MPNQPTDYSKTIIYQITCSDKTNDLIYVGSTVNFRVRKNHHKCRCYNENDKKYNLKLYKTIRDNGGWDNWNMIQIEEYPCNNKREAESREEYWRVELHAQLNMKKAFGAETIIEYQKIYREEYKERLSENKKQYCIKNKDILSENKKQYYIENKEHLQDYKQQYFQANKHVRYICECGWEGGWLKKSRHLKYNIHLNWLKQNN